MHNKINYFHNNQGIGTYPCTFSYYSLGDCTPNNPDALYTITDHGDDDTYLDAHEDEALEISIPSRLAAFQLIRDINNQVNAEINGYANLSNPSAPLDDASYDIQMAIDACQELIHYDLNF